MGSLAGIWLSLDPVDPGTMLMFDAHGRFAIDNAGHVDERPIGRGDYTLEQSSLILIDPQDPLCGNTTWAARLVTAGHLQLTLGKAGPSCCSRTATPTT